MGTGNQGEDSRVAIENVGLTGGPSADQGSGNENVNFHKQKRVSLGSGKYLQTVWRISKSKNQSPEQKLMIDETLSTHYADKKFPQLQPVCRTWSSWANSSQKFLNDQNPIWL